MQYSCGRSFDLLCSPTRDVTQLTYRKTELVSCLERKGDGSGESTPQLPLWPGFKSQGRHHMWVELLLVFLLAPGGFSPCTSVFPSPQKPPRPNSNSIRNARTRFVGKQISIFVDCYKLQNNWRPNFIAPQGKEVVQIKRFFSLLRPPPPFPSFLVVIASF